MLYILAGSRPEALHWSRIFELMLTEWTYVGSTPSMLYGETGGTFVTCPSWFDHHGNGPWADANHIIERLAINRTRRDFERQEMIDLDSRQRRAVIIATERRLARLTAANAERVNSEGTPS